MLLAFPHRDFDIFEFGIGDITKMDNVTSPFILSIFPNPTSDKINVNINGLDNSTVSVSLTNAVMVKVMDMKWSVIEMNSIMKLT